MSDEFIPRLKSVYRHGTIVVHDDGGIFVVDWKQWYSFITVTDEMHND